MYLIFSIDNEEYSKNRELVLYTYENIFFFNKEH
jgi:hypothetical protein